MSVSTNWTESLKANKTDSIHESQISKLIYVLILPVYVVCWTSVEWIKSLKKKRRKIETNLIYRLYEKLKQYSVLLIHGVKNMMIFFLEIF